MTSVSVASEGCENLSRPLFGVTFNRDSLETLATALARTPTPGQGVRLLVTANTDHIVLLTENAGLRNSYKRAWRRTVDGMPVWLYGKLRAKQMPDRVTGADLFPVVLRELEPFSHRPFFVAATYDIARHLLDWADRAGFPSGAADIEVPPFGFELDEAYGAALAARIRGRKTTHLFFGVGCPRSEVWIDQYRQHLGDVYAMAVGAALGFFTGTQRRAPSLIGRIGFEWLWRMLQEPRRLGPRYLGRGWKFFGAIISDLRGRSDLI